MTLGNSQMSGRKYSRMFLEVTKFFVLLCPVFDSKNEYDRKVWQTGDCILLLSPSSAMQIRICHPALPCRSEKRTEISQEEVGELKGLIKTNCNNCLSNNSKKDINLKVSIIITLIFNGLKMGKVFKSNT